ncbi:GBS Bsp-like repeat-containing protein [Acetobacterium wieringae]|uniref:GBS Bsp-like repeat-containing protein n=1 Tax=Acetobacterium wieringae TaxID=52694 RepID=A0ABY6HAY0_9FIRM|nr:GBS Bsp-like repeat-containing protein [Acetobacterium wieringae]UYO61608.1 GBS Bsp-like repeat-containing protein [Acetobacterium wieringae]
MKRKEIKWFVLLLVIGIGFPTLVWAQDGELPVATENPENFINTNALFDEAAQEVSTTSNNGTLETSMTMSEFEQKLSQWKSKYPNGSKYDEEFGNATGLAWECHGYARFLTQHVFGVECMNGTAPGWVKHRDISRLAPGDLVRYSNDNHTVFVTAVSGENVTITDANVPYGTNRVRWGVPTTKAHLNATLTYIAHYNANPVAATPADTTSPVISKIWIDDQAGTGRMMYIEASDNVGISRIWCPTWAPGETEYFSKDASPQAGSNTVWMCAMMADDHGMKQGAYLTHVYAFDAAGNKIGIPFNYYIDFDKPTVSDVQISDVNQEGFTVNCRVADSVSGISKVMFPTWTSAGSPDQDDLIWHQGTLNGNIASYRVRYSDHKNEKGFYNIHIYAYDNAGNVASGGTTINIDMTPPVISDVKVSNVTLTGYTVTCKVSDNSGINRVQFPTWSLVNGQDDLDPNWNISLKSSGVISGDTVTFQVKSSEHNNEKGLYRTHIYAFDNFGNSSYIRVEDVLKDTNLVDEEKTDKPSIPDIPITPDTPSIPDTPSEPGYNDDDKTTDVTCSYQTHVQNEGWQAWKTDGEMSGTSGKGLRLEGIKIKLGIDSSVLGLSYATHVQNIGWQDPVANGELSGTSSKGLRLEAIKINLTGTKASQYDIYYRVHAQNVGWLDWAKNGEASGTAGFGYRLEAIEIRIVPQNSPAPGSTENVFLEKITTEEVINKLVGTWIYKKNNWTEERIITKLGANKGHMEFIQYSTLKGDSMELDFFLSDINSDGKAILYIDKKSLKTYGISPTSYKIAVDTLMNQPNGIKLNDLYFNRQ